MQDRKSIIYRNISFIFKDRLSEVQIAELVKRNLSNLFRRQRFLEQLSMMEPEEIEKFIPCTEGEGHLKEALKYGKGVILLSAHFFCCELGLIWLSYRGFRMNLVYDVAEGERKGMSLLAKTFQGKGINLIESAGTFKVKVGEGEFLFRDAYAKKKEIIRRLYNNEVVTMLPDMHPGDKVKGVYVNFLDKQTYVGYAPFKLARETGAKVVPALAIPTQDGKFKGIIYPLLSFLEGEDNIAFYTSNMQKYMEMVESYVWRYPEEYCWHQPGRWEDDPADRN